MLRRYFVYDSAVKGQHCVRAARPGCPPSDASAGADAEAISQVFKTIVDENGVEAYEGGTEVESLQQARVARQALAAAGLLHGDERAYFGGVWPGLCVFPDFTRRSTREWWASLYAAFMQTGVDGVWNDMNEPSVFDSATGTMDTRAWHGGMGEGGAPHSAIHNAYGMLMAMATKDGIARALPERRPFVLTRANIMGGQRFAATWTGDNASAPDWLEWTVPMNLNLAISNVPLVGTHPSSYRLVGGYAPLRLSRTIRMADAAAHRCLAARLRPAVSAPAVAPHHVTTDAGACSSHITPR